MRFNSHPGFNNPPHSINLSLRNGSPPPGGAHHHMHARCGYDLEPPVEPAPKKDIARKEWQPELLGPVLPPMGDIVEREEGLKSLAREKPRHNLLVLVARVECEPSTLNAWIIILCAIVRQMHMAPPC